MTENDSTPETWLQKFMFYIVQTFTRQPQKYKQQIKPGIEIINVLYHMQQNAIPFPKDHSVPTRKNSNIAQDNKSHPLVIMWITHFSLSLFPF